MNRISEFVPVCGDFVGTPEKDNIYSIFDIEYFVTRILYERCSLISYIKEESLLV